MAFTISISQQIRQELRAMQEAADRASTGDLLLSAIRTISERLQTDPLEYGEVLYHLPSSLNPVHVGITIPLAIIVAVYPQAQRVWLVKVRALSGHGL